MTEHVLHGLEVVPATSDRLTDDAGAIGNTLTNAANAYRGIDDATARTLGGDPGQGAVDDG